MIEIFAVLFDPQNFCNGCWLQCGRVPGEFLAFSLLPGIGRAWYHWLYIVVDQTFTSGGGGGRVDLHTLIHDHNLCVCVCVFNFHGWPRQQNYFNSKIFPIYGTIPVLNYMYVMLHFSTAMWM